MKCYFTLGQEHVHRINGKTLDKDCVAVIEGEDFDDCRKLAFEWFKDKFHQQKTSVDERFMAYFPRGLIGVNCEV